MSRSEVDWKRQQRHVLDWAMVALALALAASFLVLWRTDGRLPYAGPALLLLAWTGAYLSSLWQPIGYVLGAVVATGAVGMMVALGHHDHPVAWMALALGVLFSALSVYLFVHEDRLTNP